MIEKLRQNGYSFPINIYCVHTPLRFLLLICSHKVFFNRKMAFRISSKIPKAIDFNSLISYQLISLTSILHTQRVIVRLYFILLSFHKIAKYSYFSSLLYALLFVLIRLFICIVMSCILPALFLVYSHKKSQDTLKLLYHIL